MRVVGAEHYQLAERMCETITRYTDQQDIILLLGIEELRMEHRLIIRPPADCSAS